MICQLYHVLFAYAAWVVWAVWVVVACGRKELISLPGQSWVMPCKVPAAGPASCPGYYGFSTSCVACRALHVARCMLQVFSLSLSLLSSLLYSFSAFLSKFARIFKLLRSFYVRRHSLKATLDPHSPFARLPFDPVPCPALHCPRDRASLEVYAAA